MEVLGWIDELSLSMKRPEYILAQACTFAYHCTRLLCQIRNVLSGSSNLVSATYASIMQQINEMEKIWNSSYDPAPPSISSVGVHAYQGNFRMHLSAGVLAFLDHLSKSNMLNEQHCDLNAIQERCIAAFRATATAILKVQDMSHEIHHSPTYGFNL